MRPLALALRLGAGLLALVAGSACEGRGPAGAEAATPGCPAAPSAAAPALYRCEVLYRLLDAQRFLASAAPEGFAYDPRTASEAVEEVLGAAAAAAPGDWWRAEAAGALRLLSELGALDPGASRSAWLQDAYDLIAVVLAFEVLTEEQLSRVAEGFPDLGREDDRAAAVALWAELGQSFRANLERPRSLAPREARGRPAGAPAEPLDAEAGPLVVAHQGGLSRWPPNSLAAFRRARDLGADGIECDLRLSGDGRVFVLHDERLALPGDPDGRVVRVSRAPGWELQRLRLHDPFALDRPSGESPLPLEELLRELGGELLLWLELKPDGGERLPEAVGDLLAERPALLGSVVVSSLAPRMLRPLRERFPELAVAYESVAIDPSAVESHAARPDAHRLIVSVRHFPTRAPEALRRAEELGLRTSAFTLNRFDELERALAAGVDLIQTDRPDRALWLRSRVPPAPMNSDEAR